MHLRRILLLNSGPTERCSLELPFHDDGRPKPVLIVGSNGAGKTNLLSTVADGLMELAATHFRDVLPASGAGHSFYRVVGGRTRRLGAKFDMGALHFHHGGKDFFFRSSSGSPPFEELASELEPFGPLGASNRGETKLTHVDEELVEDIFRAGAYVYFPSSRHEIPHWLNDRSLESDPPLGFGDPFTNQLGKPLVLTQGIGPLKPWIIDLILDQSLDVPSALQVMGAGTGGTLPQIAQEVIRRSQSFQSLNVLISAILDKPNARVMRLLGERGNRRLQVHFDGGGLPTLDALSAGQATLLSIFGNAYRLGTTTQPIPLPENATGIVLVDEIDAHLHADLQYSALPSLMKVFPNVQFIVTCHSPIFPLGMEKHFGSDGFRLLEMPGAVPISCERYSEFLRSFEMYKETKAFEEALGKLGSAGRPIVIGEGETDPLYLSTAAELLGYADLVAGVDFSWIGQVDKAAKGTSGQGQLKKAADIYRATLPLLGRKVMCLFDQKSHQQVKAKAFTAGLLSARILPLVDDHPHANDGPENLLPPELFEDQFFATKTSLQGTKTVTVRDLKKVEFAKHVCEVLRDPAHFERFRPLLDDLRATLLTAPGSNAPEAPPA